MTDAPLLFALNMAAAAGLLIWAVRLVRTGFERVFGGRFRIWIRRSTSRRISAATSGAFAAILLQSSTAVAVLVSSFIAAGTIGGTAGLALLLGADVGSAVVALLLSSRIDAVMPVLLLIGVLIFLKSRRRRPRQIGRILIGLALVFVSLDMIRAASAPLAESPATLAVMVYLATDVATAFVVAALFAWGVHSSVAAILLFVTLATQGLLPSEAAVAMVLGANMGGAFIPVMLTLKSPAAVRRIVLTNFVLRGGGAAAVLLASWFGWLSAQWLSPDVGRQALYVHVLFNLVLALGLLPLAGRLANLSALILPDEADTEATTRQSHLDDGLLDKPRRAFACAARELVDMGGQVENMLRRVIRLFEVYDEDIAHQIRADHRQVEAMAADLKIYLARIHARHTVEMVGSRAFDLSGTAVNLSMGADLIATRIIGLADRKATDGLEFSDEGWRELTDFHDMVLQNIQHGISVLVSEDVGLARDLVEQKETLRRTAQDLERRHIERLSQGMTPSIETSAIHLSLLRALKSLNSSFAMTAYPQLSGSGELLQSRLAVQSRQA